MESRTPRRAVRVSVTPTMEQYVAVTSELIKLIVRRMWVIPTLAVLCLFSFLVAIAVGGFDDVSLSAYFWGIAFPLIFLVGLPLLQRIQRRKRWNQSPELRVPFTYTFDEEGIHTQSELGSGKVSWPVIRRVVLRRGFVILLTGQNIGYYFPASVLSGADRECFEQLLREHVAGFERLE